MHTPGSYHGHSFTKTCLLDFTYEMEVAQYVVKPGWSLNVCESYAVGAKSVTFKSSEWFCTSDGKWHNMANRGFWNYWK